MSDYISAIWDSFVELVVDIANVIKDVVVDLWKEILAPIVEEFFNLLGFEDQTVVNGFVVINRVMSQSWQNPYKQAVISKVQNNTTMSDEIKNIFLTGYQVRIKRYMAYGETTYYYGLPTAGFSILTVKESAVDSIITTEEGYAITIQTIKMGSNTVDHYARQYMQDNFVGASPYRFIGGTDIITLAGVNNYIDAISYDAINDAYDVDYHYFTEFSYEVLTAINNPPSPASTYFWDWVAATAISPVISITSTYDVTIGADIQFTPDTATHSSVGTLDATQAFTPDTAVNGSPAAVSSAGFDDGEVTGTFQELVPASAGVGRGYEVTYKPDSALSDADSLRYWSYTLSSGDITYPQLYDATPNPGSDIEKIVPVVPIKVNNVYQESGQGITPESRYLTSKILLKRMNLDMKVLIDALKDTIATESTSISDAFVVYGIDLSDTNSSNVVNKYLWEFFNNTLVGFGGTWAEYLVIKADLDAINSGSTVSEDVMLDKYLGVNWETDRIPAYYQVNIDYWPFGSANYNNWLNAWNARRDELVTEVRGTINSKYGASKIKVSVIEQDYNISYSVQAVENNVIAGVLGPIGTYTKVIVPTDYVLMVRKQINETQYSEIKLYLLHGFTVLKTTGNEVQFAALDFINDDVGGTNVKNNFLIPISYGILKQLDVFEQKQLVYEATHLNIFTKVVTELRYYETPDFVGFFSGVIKIAAIVYIFYSGGDLSGAEYLWAIATNYSYKVVIEYIITKIVLNNPDSDLALFAAIILAVLAAAYAGTEIEASIDTALLALSAVSQVTAVYVDVKSDILQSEVADFLKDSREKQDELKELYETEGFADRESLLETIKKIIVTRVEDPEQFYQRTRTINLSEEFLNLDRLLSLDSSFQQPIINQSTSESV